MSTTLPTLYVYGDSYSDITNSNRKTNGPIWSQRVAKGWGLQLQSYATVGSQSCPTAGINMPSIAGQMDRYTGTTTRPDAKDVHAFFIGVTDIINATKYDANKLVGCIKEQIVRLQTINPKAQILLLGLPPLEYSPYYADTKKQTQIKKRVNEYNVGLEDMVTDTTIDDSRATTLSYIDNNYLFADILGNPAGYGLQDVDRAYWDKCQGRCDDSMDTYLWWDSIHLTGAGHKAIADTIVAKNPFGYTIIKDTTYDNKNNNNGDNHTGLSLYADDYMDYAPWFMLLCLLVMVIVLMVIRPKRRSIVKWTPWKRRKSHVYTAVSSSV
ncbi:hypothetical protein BC941DRAFT_417430 [Chlamydoabsidia padenii]|nr:hypothetical protein BC941DRAFT_417430 [Chlamydoabsidia padenii]